MNKNDNRNKDVKEVIDFNIKNIISNKSADKAFKLKNNIFEKIDDIDKFLTKVRSKLKTLNEEYRKNKVEKEKQNSVENNDNTHFVANNRRYNSEDKQNSQYSSNNRRFNNGERQNSQYSSNNRQYNGKNGQQRKNYTANGGQYNSNNQYSSNGFNRNKNGNFNNRNGFNKGPNAERRFVDSVIKTEAPTMNLKENNNKFKDAINKKKNTHDKSYEKKGLSVKEKMRMGFMDEVNDDSRQVYRKVKVKKNKDEKTEAQINALITHAVITTDNLTVKLLSETISRPVNAIITKMLQLGIMGNINSAIEYDVAELVASELGVTLEKKIEASQEDQLQVEIEAAEKADAENLVSRSPVVTVMGHVDHGKTSLLDAFRKTNVIEGEAGGITQHIGAYTVRCKDKKITFIDTPGHAAFTAMRARGAQVTDIAILVVAADDGLMPQTLEAIDHIKSANVPMIVAINKVDKQDANPEKIRQQLADHGVLWDNWGGDVIMVEISAKYKQNLEELLEMILLQAEMLDLKANPNGMAYGAVLESKLDKGMGAVANVIVQNGTLKVGDNIICGTSIGKIRALIDEHGKNVKKAGPSTPVAVIGFDEVPNAGERIYTVDEKRSKKIIAERKNKLKTDLIKNGSTTVNIDEMFNANSGVNNSILNVIIKTDVQGSAEALKGSLMGIESDEVKVKVIHANAGAITENDVILAKASNAVLINFNQKTTAKIASLCEHEGVEILNSSIIYQAIDYVEAKVKGLETPKYDEVVIGHAEIRLMFKLSSVGQVAGSYVLDGKITRNCMARVYRKDKLIAETKIVSIKMHKNDVKEAGATYECGIKFDDDIQCVEGDTIEAYILEPAKK